MIFNRALDFFIHLGKGPITRSILLFLSGVLFWFLMLFIPAHYLEIIWTGNVVINMTCLLLPLALLLWGIFIPSHFLLLVVFPGSLLLSHFNRPELTTSSIFSFGSFMALSMSLCIYILSVLLFTSPRGRSKTPQEIVEPDPARERGSGRSTALLSIFTGLAMLFLFTFIYLSLFHSPFQQMIRNRYAIHESLARIHIALILFGVWLVIVFRMMGSFISTSPGPSMRIKSSTSPLIINRGAVRVMIVILLVISIILVMLLLIYKQG
jgi:hypothetical protein